MQRHIATLWTVVLCTACGCQPSSPGPVNTTLPQAAPEETAAEPERRAVALEARQMLFEQLLGRLMEALEDGQPATAISVCKLDAPRIAKEVGQRCGVSIGRTSFRLRNSKNVPPAWAETLVEQRVDEPTFVDLDDGRLAALLPIRLQPPCLMCHGPAEQIAEDVKLALGEQYPEDQATGFQVGELRGWFWVEVPAR